MRIMSQIPELNRKVVLTTGNFDGLHIGHMGLVQQLVSLARKEHLPSVMVTFDPHPLELLHPGRKIPRINGLSEMAQFLEPEGLDFLIQLPFTHELADMSPELFFRRVLVDTFHPQTIIVGQDHHFGKNREGTPDLLQQLGAESGMEVTVFPQVIRGGAPVSSTRIRKLIARGDVQKSRELLGHPLLYTGTVQKGAGRGAQLGFPTANLSFDDRILPDSGVYLSQTQLKDKWIPSITYVGKSPTFSGDRELMETYLLSKSLNMYDEQITVDIQMRIRGDKQFASREELVHQIKCDLEEAKKRRSSLSES